MADRGTRTSEKKSSAKDCPPVMVVSGRASIPAVVRSTRKHVIPRCFLADGSVRTYSWHQSAKWPIEFQVFCPLTTKWSPSSTAWVRSAARSEPASGSDMPCDQISSPRSIGVRNRAFCSAVPKCMIAGAMLETPITFSGPGARTRFISSK